MDQPRFELITQYKNCKELLPVRSTDGSAGYDFFVAEDIIIPSYHNIFSQSTKTLLESAKNLNTVADYTKKYNCRPTLVPTGVKAYMPKDLWLQIVLRSSCAVKNWLVMPNSVGVIDSDYYNNLENEGHIYIPVINFFTSDIQLHKGDRIGQGIFTYYVKVENDQTTNTRIGGMGSTGV